MNAIRLLLAASLLIVPLSGCLSGGDKDVDTTSDAPGATGDSTDAPTGTTGPAPTATATTAPPAAAGSPVAKLTVLLEGSEVSAVDGSFEVPAGADVTFDASTSSDPDGDALTYGWKVDGAAAGSAANLVQAFTAGDHSVEVTVSDGKLSDSETASVVAAGSSGGCPAPGEDPVVSLKFEGTLAAQATAGTKFPFEVPDCIKQLTAYLKWTSPTELVGEAASVNLTLALTNATAGATATTYGSTLDFEYVRINDTAALGGGAWTAEVLPPAALPTDVAFELSFLLWKVQPNTVTFEEAVTGSSCDPPAEVSAVTCQRLVKKVTMPAGVEAVAGRLTWLSADSKARCGGQGYVGADFDLKGFFEGEEKFGSGNFVACEFGYIDAEPGETLSESAGDWDFQVTAYEVVNNRYTLTVDYV